MFATVTDVTPPAKAAELGIVTDPPFPGNVPTAPLLRLSLEKLRSRDAQELQGFAQACENVGFFYLDLRGPGDAILDLSSRLFDVSKDLFELSLEEKMKYNFEHLKTYFGYKHMGASVTDGSGNLDRNEFYNVSQSHSANLH